MSRWLASFGVLVSFPVLADPFFLIGQSHFAASQNYRVENRNCELGLMNARGNSTYKKIDLMIEATAQSGAFECVQSFESKAFALGVQAYSTQYAIDGVIFRQEYFSTGAKPMMTLIISPLFSAGVELNFENLEYKDIDHRYSASTYVSTISGSFHQETWELTLAFADRYRNEDFPNLSIPRETTVNVRASPSSAITVGARMNRVDYPGIAIDEDDDAQAEVNSSLILASEFMNMYSGEFAYELTSSVGGDPDSKGSSLSIMAGVAVDQSIKLGAQVTIDETSSALADSNLTTFSALLGYAL